MHFAALRQTFQPTGERQNSVSKRARCGRHGVVLLRSVLQKLSSENDPIAIERAGAGLNPMFGECRHTFARVPGSGRSRFVDSHEPAMLGWPKMPHGLT